jgi:hypothetical protein
MSSRDPVVRAAFTPPVSRRLHGAAPRFGPHPLPDGRHHHRPFDPLRASDPRAFGSSRSGLAGRRSSNRPSPCGAVGDLYADPQAATTTSPKNFSPIQKHEHHRSTPVATSHSHQRSPGPLRRPTPPLPGWAKGGPDMVTPCPSEGRADTVRIWRRTCHSSQEPPTSSKSPALARRRSESYRCCLPTLSGTGSGGKLDYW